MRGVVNIEDLRKLARKRLPKIAYDFIEGGTDDEVGLVTRWLEGAAGKAELLGVRGRLASPAVGGALLQLRYDPGRHRHAWPPGEARGRPEARPSRRPARWPAGSMATVGR